MKFQKTFMVSFILLMRGMIFPKLVTAQTHLGSSRDSASFLPAVGTMKIAYQWEKPTAPTEGTVHATSDHSKYFSIYRNGRWETMNGWDPRVCNDLLYSHPIMHDPGEQGKALALIPDTKEYDLYSYSTGEVFPASISKIQCHGGTMWVQKRKRLPRSIEEIRGNYVRERYEYSAMILDTRSGLPMKNRVLTATLPHDSEQWTPMMVQGKEAFCVPQYAPEFDHYSPSVKFKNWGILSSSGKWLIAPIFDEPFTFVNGIAEVVHDGQHRKINNMGEFVE